MHGQQYVKSADFVQVTGRRSVVRRRRKSSKRKKNVRRRTILVKMILRNILREAEEFRYL